MRTFEKSSKLDYVCYDIRGPIMDEAQRMSEQGIDILKLNIGNPAPFGFKAPKEIEEAKLLFIMTYPNILKELMNGKILYIDNYTGYLGHKEIKGPYGEEEIFIPEYTSNNLSLIEIIIDIENKIKNNKKKIRK